MRKYYEPVPMTKAEWADNKEWLVNRALFLINTKDKNNDFFWGSARQNGKIKQGYFSNCFNPEYVAMCDLHPASMIYATSIWARDMNMEYIRYLGEEDFESEEAK